MYGESRCRIYATLSRRLSCIRRGTDNKLLGVPEMTGAELQATVEQLVSVELIGSMAGWRT
jgi:hypothetical protein